MKEAIFMDKLWWEETPKTKKKKRELIEAIEMKLEDDFLGEFECEYGKKETRQIETALKKRLKELKAK